MIAVSHLVRGSGAVVNFGSTKITRTAHVSSGLYGRTLTGRELAMPAVQLSDR
jgi:hypothetical protein